MRDSAIFLEVNSPGPVLCFWKQFPDHTQWSQNASVLLMVFFQSLFRPGNSCKSHCLFYSALLVLQIASDHPPRLLLYYIFQ